ncbi:MAG TPA: LptA/OstA family protein [Acetobacteraceae bacterium]|nr:LptA/OstA family protein [Acetobacteraceae bacterium]
MRRWAVLLPLLALILGTRMAVAQPLDLSQGGPITITSLGGIEWRQNQQVVIAQGDAQAVRGAVTVTADELIAHYRPKPGAASAPGQVQPASTAATAGSADTGGQQIYRLEAVGHVHIFTATDQAFADHAVYDLDQAVLVLTGGHLKLTTPNDVLTARDDVEYWPDKHMAVARGDAVVVTNDGRRLTADTLVAYTTPAPASANGPADASGSTASTRQAGAQNTADPLASSGQIKRVEAFGNVTIRTATDTITGDRGVYVPSSGIALILGDVRITRGQNQLNGARGVVDMKTGQAELLSAPGERVQGLVVPNTVNQPAGKPAPGNQSAGGQP